MAGLKPAWNRLRTPLRPTKREPAIATPDLAVLEAVLLGHRFPSADIPPVDVPGLYALFLAPGAALPALAVGPTGLLYIGMTDSSLDVRNHFRHAHSG